MTPDSGNDMITIPTIPLIKDSHSWWHQCHIVENTLGVFGHKIWNFAIYLCMNNLRSGMKGIGGKYNTMP